MEITEFLLDPGHDDVEGQECKDGRSRTWMILLYPDDPSHKVVLDSTLAELDWNYAGILHDSDDGVKPHYHIVVLFKDGRKNTDIANDLGIDKRFLRAWDRKKKALRYLCHKDQSDKYRYPTDLIFGTIAEQAVSACSKGNELSERDSIKELCKVLNEIDGFVSYSFFLSYVADLGLYPVFRRLGVVATRLIDEHNSIFRAKLRADEEGLCAAKRFSDWYKDFSSLPFAEQCEILDRHGFSPKSL